MMKNLFFENIGMKIASIVLAAILWFFVTLKGQSEISLDIPLELKNIPHGLESVKQGTRFININIKGQERLFKNMKSSDVKVQVDLNSGRKGKGTYYIRGDDIKLPAAMSVTSISPSTVWVILEETVIKSVPVQPIITGSPKKGFVVGSVDVTPKDVTIEGAMSEVNRIKFLKTEPIDIADMSENFIQDVKLDISGRNIRTEIQDAIVKVIIHKK